MKKGICIMLTFLLLTGCAAVPQEEMMEINQETVLTQPTEVLTEATEPELLSALIEPENTDFVRVTDYIPSAAVELKYSTDDNFTGHRIYEFDDVFLRYGTVMKLKAVSTELASLGLSLKIWDGFRPVSAQFRLWEICPDPTYVANPNKGFSNHSRGYAVDLTLIDSDGIELEMPTGFDDFSSRADRDYSDCTEQAAENARLLDRIMEKYGFSGYWGEWWHFNDTQKYDVEECFDPGIIARRHIMEDAVLLRSYSDTESEILIIPKQEPVTLLGYSEEYAMVEYWGYRGYVQSALLY